jgi:hypothetical protein
MSYELRSGFLELLTLNKHKLQIAGLKQVALQFSHDPTIDRSRNTLLSWDEKNLILWEHGKLSKHLKLNDSKDICSITYISKIKCFLMATKNMNFIFYDSNFKVLEIVSHSERMITAIEYDTSGNNVIICSSGGKQLILIHSLNMDNVFNE